jgi:DNA repair protein RadA/Sms
VEETESLGASKRQTTKVSVRNSARLSDIASQNEQKRFRTGVPELDRVFGGGMVKGSLTLISGEPGIGKSTLVAMIAGEIARQNACVLYISGEESAPQLASRFSRLHQPLDHIQFLEAYPVEVLTATIKKECPSLVIVDSVQTLESQDVEGLAGSPTLVRYATSLLLEAAKTSGIPILLVGQVTKDGSVAGPKTLEHIVDTVLYLEGDPVHAYRILRARKNRFGSTDEIGVFEMTPTGLMVVENPSARFLEERATIPGSVITATAEGSRVFLVEVQALVSPCAYGNPVRRASGFDANRLQMLCAILAKRTGIKLGEQDVYVNVIGGLTLEEPAADLAICASILQAATHQADTQPTVYMGEVGLGGEVRSVPLLERRLEESKRLGITKAVIPDKKQPVKAGVEVRGISHVGLIPDAPIQKPHASFGAPKDMPPN